MQIINTTQYTLIFEDKKGNRYKVTPQELIQAYIEFFMAGENQHDIVLKKINYTSTSESIQTLQKMEKEYPDAIIVGHLIAAQAFPGRVFALCPIDGYEKVKNTDKIYKDWEFITFGE